MQRAHQQMSGYAPSQDAPDDEAMMDFLAGREEFMLSIEEAAQTALGRLSRGVGDAEFEEAMVHLLDVVQRRLAYARPQDSVTTASECGVPLLARLPRVAIGAAAFATLAALVVIITFVALSSGGGGRSSLVFQVTGTPQATETLSTPIATKAVSTPSPEPAQPTPTPLASPGSSAQVSAQPGGQGKLTAATTPTRGAVEGPAATPTPANVAPKPQAVAAKAVASRSVTRPALSTPKPIVAKPHPKERSPTQLQARWEQPRASRT